MDQPINPNLGHQSTCPPVPHYGSIDGKGRVNNSDPSAPLDPASASTVQIIADDDETYEDIYKFTPHVKIGYDEIFKESGSIRGFPFMKKVNGSIFKYTHFALYVIVTTILGPILSFVWAVIFALTNILIIWLIQPSIKLFYSWLRICSLLYAPLVRLFLDPLWLSTSLVFSKIRGSFRINSSDVTLNLKTSQV